MFWFSVLDFKHSRLCWIFLTKFSSSKVLVWLFIELLTVSFILMLLELKIPVFSMCSSLVKSRLLFKFELMPDNELDDKRLLIPMTPFLICWSLNWMKSLNALDAASIRASFLDFPWPTYFWPSTYKDGWTREEKKWRDYEEKKCSMCLPWQTWWRREHGRDPLEIRVHTLNSSWARWVWQLRSLVEALDSRIPIHFLCGVFATMLKAQTKKTENNEGKKYWKGVKVSERERWTKSGKTTKIK